MEWMDGKAIVEGRPTISRARAGSSRPAAAVRGASSSAFFPHQRRPSRDCLTAVATGLLLSDICWRRSSLILWLASVPRPPPNRQAGWLIERAEKWALLLEGTKAALISQWFLLKSGKHKLGEGDGQPKGKAQSFRGIAPGERRIAQSLWK